MKRWGRMSAVTIGPRVRLCCGGGGEHQMGKKRMGRIHTTDSFKLTAPAGGSGVGSRKGRGEEDVNWGCG
ncbi:hypothetical protein ACLOJK_009633 [Asimina triloba]